MRIHRQTEQGTSYVASFTEPPSHETLDALDHIADAARKLVGPDDGEQQKRLEAIRERVERKVR
jgi:hypothetical protein